MWSSRSQKFTGHSMTHEELSTLCDVYQTLSLDFRQKQTSYVLQTLWRDLTSEVRTYVLYHSDYIVLCWHYPCLTCSSLSVCNNTVPTHIYAHLYVG